MGSGYKSQFFRPPRRVAPFLMRTWIFMSIIIYTVRSIMSEARQRRHIHFIDMTKTRGDGANIPLYRIRGFYC